MNDTIKSLPNGDFYVIPEKKPAPQPAPAPAPVLKKEPIRSRPKKG